MRFSKDLFIGIVLIVKRALFADASVPFALLVLTGNQIIVIFHFLHVALVDRHCGTSDETLLFRNSIFVMMVIMESLWANCSRNCSQIQVYSGLHAHSISLGEEPFLIESKLFFSKPIDEI